MKAMLVLVLWSVAAPEPVVIRHPVRDMAECSNTVKAVREILPEIGARGHSGVMAWCERSRS